MTPCVPHLAHVGDHHFYIRQAALAFSFGEAWTPNIFPKLAISLHYGAVIAATRHEIVSPSREVARQSYNRSKTSQSLRFRLLHPPPQLQPSLHPIFKISDISMHVPRSLSSVFHAPVVIRMQLRQAVIQASFSFCDPQCSAVKVQTNRTE